MLMFKVDESFQEKDTDHKILLIVSCSICLFLFESLKLIIQFPPRFDQIAGCSELLKYFNIFQKFLSSSKCFLFHVNVSYFFYLAPKEFFFLEQNQFLQLLELVKILHENFNFDFVCSIIVPLWRRKKLLFM